MGGGHRELLAQMAHNLAPKISVGTQSVCRRSVKTLFFNGFITYRRLASRKLKLSGRKTTT
jgi:hypothetical protein